MKRLAISLAFAALLTGLLSAISPVRDAWVGWLLHFGQARDAERIADRPPRREPSIENLEPEVFALLERASHCRVFRLSQEPDGRSGPAIFGYQIRSQIAVDGKRWSSDFVRQYVRGARVGVVGMPPLTPVLGIQLDVPGGSADILIGDCESRGDHGGAMLIGVRTAAGILTLKARSPMFSGWPAPPDSAVQELRLAFPM